MVVRLCYLSLPFQLSSLFCILSLAQSFISKERAIEFCAVSTLKPHTMDGKDRPRRRRRHRRRKSSINTDLLDSDSDGERTKKMDEVELAPESRWRQLRYQTYLRERMRNGIRAQNAVWVDTMGRPVTLAERILRFRVEQQEKEQTEVAHAESQVNKDNYD